jgi:hypothetical protein
MSAPKKTSPKRSTRPPTDVEEARSYANWLSTFTATARPAGAMTKDNLATMAKAAAVLDDLSFDLASERQLYEKEMDRTVALESARDRVIALLESSPADIAAALSLLRSTIKAP